MRPRSTPGRVWICCAVAAVAVVARPAAAEADAERGTSNPSSEVVPEFDAYIKLSDQARLFLLADVARLSPDDVTNGEVGIHLDYTLKPILRAQLREADWARDRYLWVRVGYRRLGNLEGNAGGASENRLLLEGTGRFELPHEVWIVNRLRVDLRDVEGLHSTRYRYRIGAEKEFSTAAGTVFLPYAQAEWFYDTRFDAWSRQRYQLGVEIELNESWRVEPYYALDKDRVPTAESVSRLGLVLKYYQ